MRTALWFFVGLFMVPTMIGVMVRWFMNGMAGDVALPDLMFATIAFIVAMILDWIASRKPQNTDPA